LLALAYPGGATDGQRAPVVNAVVEALRMGATYPSLAHAVISPRFQDKKPWDRIQAAGRDVANLLAEARSSWPEFKGQTLSELLEHVNRKQPQDELAFRVAGWGKVATWPAEKVLT
jgi:hypothetical protein